MGKVYQSLKEVVKLQRSKNDPVALAGGKHTHASSLDGEIGELVHRISGLKVAVEHREEEIRKETQQVIQTLSEDFAMLETKLKDVEETARRKDSVSQKTEERLITEKHALENELNTAKETLNRDNEIKDLKSNVDGLMKQLTESENAIKQAQAEAATEANRTNRLTDSFNTKIAALEVQLSDVKEIVRGKESAIAALEQKLSTETQAFENELRNKEELLAKRDNEINDLKSKLEVLTGKIQGMSSFLKQAETLAAVEGQNSVTPGASETESGVTEKPADSPFRFKVPYAQTAMAQQTVPSSFFDLMSQELTEIIGPNAPAFAREHVAALGESIEKFPKSRLAELLEILSQDIVNELERISFRTWFVKHAGGWKRLDV